jgi:hypothetical protein
MQDSEKQVYTVKELAELLACSRQTIIRRFQNERGVIVLKGEQRRSLRIPRFVLERVLRSMTVR